MNIKTKVKVEEKSTKDRNIHKLIDTATDDDFKLSMSGSTFGCEIVFFVFISSLIWFNVCKWTYKVELSQDENDNENKASS